MARNIPRVTTSHLAPSWSLRLSSALDVPKAGAVGLRVFTRAICALTEGHRATSPHVHDERHARAAYDHEQNKFRLPGATASPIARGTLKPSLRECPGAKPLPRESNSRRRSSDVETAQAGHDEIGKHDLRMAAASDVEPSSQSEVVRMSTPSCASAFENVP